MNLDELLIAAKAVDPELQTHPAWQAFGRALTRELLRFFSKRFGRTESEVLAQQTIVVVLEKLDDYKRLGDDSFAHYLLAIARNKARARVQASMRERHGLAKLRRMQTMAPPVVTPSWLLWIEQYELLLDYKAELPKHEQRVLDHDLADGDDRAYAKKHGIALDTVRTHRRRAKEHARRQHAAQRKTPPPARDTPPPRS